MGRLRRVAAPTMGAYIARKRLATYAPPAESVNALMLRTSEPQRRDSALFTTPFS